MLEDEIIRSPGLDAYLRLNPSRYGAQVRFHAQRTL